MYGQTGSGKTYTMFGDKKNGVPGLVRHISVNSRQIFGRF